MMYLTRNRPFADGIDRMFEELARAFGAPAPQAAADFAPRLDVAETADAWSIRVELPGVAPEDVEVALEGNVLTVRGEKKAEAKSEGLNWHRTERTYGKF